jgi:hypothetical protein
MWDTFHNNLNGRVPTQAEIVRLALEIDRLGTEQQFSANLEHKGGATLTVWTCPLSKARAAAPLGTLAKTRSHFEPGIWRGRACTDGPARRSSLLSPAWWTGPPPIPHCGPPRTTNRMTRPPRRSSSQDAARGFWIRAWGQREPAHQGTGRSNEPSTTAGHTRGWAGRSPPLTPKTTHFASNTRSER